MKEADLVGELSRRSGVPEPSVQLVLAALREAVGDGRVDELLRPDAGGAAPCFVAAVVNRVTGPGRGEAAPNEVDELITCARRHPLGLEFLKGGYLASVAAVFHADAFTVENARERLTHEPRVEAPKEVQE